MSKQKQPVRQPLAAAQQQVSAQALPAPQQQQTTFCPYCSIRLSYPPGAALIQCPKCTQIIDPLAPLQTRCVGCKCLLAYPANSLYIQCPNCYQTMDPRQVPAPSAQNTQTAGKNTTKKRKDPQAPKAVSNAYMIFCKAKRAELKKQHPDLAFGKIGAKLGEIWRSMAPEEKKPYEDRAALDRERYRREMLEYQSGKMDSDVNKKQRSDDGGISDPNSGANVRASADGSWQDGEHHFDGGDAHGAVDGSGAGGDGSGNDGAAASSVGVVPVQSQPGLDISHSNSSADDVHQ